MGTSTGERSITPNDKAKFQAIVWVGLIIGTITNIIFHVCVQENSEEKEVVKKYNNNCETRISVGEILSSVKYYQVKLVWDN